MNLFKKKVKQSAPIQAVISSQAGPKIDEPIKLKTVCNPPCESCKVVCCLSCNSLRRLELSQSLVVTNPDDWRIKFNAPYDRLEFSCVHDDKRHVAKLSEPVKACPLWNLKIITAQDRATHWV
ncbi:MAG: hypothetical protein ABSA75_10290 [Candidatus Bathyarchaeia archaeon]|jgi:hypothetical protein